VAQVSRQVLSDIDQDITVVHQVDSICEPCAKLVNGICQTQLGDELLMRDYNDPLDAGLFELLELVEGQQLSVRDFLQRVQGRLDAVVQLFTRGDRELRRTRTRNALKMLRI
jgi:hypothetical protein